MTFAAELAAAADATKYARQIPFYTADRLHPEIRFTRLGAVLRSLASDDPSAADGGELDPAIALARGVIENGGPHDGPMNLLPLHVLRDYMLEHPEHPLAKRFNWEHLPEKVALDRTVRQHHHPTYGFGHLMNNPSLYGEEGYNLFRRIREQHTWASIPDVQESARREHLKRLRGLYDHRYDSDGRHEEYPHPIGAEGRRLIAAERYSRDVADAIEQPLRYAADPQSHAAFHAAIAKANATGDLLPRKVYADVLEENGDHFDDDTLKLLRSDDPRPVYFHPSRKGKWAARTWPRLTISDIRRINREKGGHYFSPNTMRFFGTRLERRIHQGDGGTFFVHSGDNFDRTGRVWRVAHFDPDTGRTASYISRPDPAETLWFNDDFGSREAAHAAAAHLAKHGTLPPEESGDADEQPEQMQRRDARPVRYGKAKRRLTVHPLLRGTRLAVALRTLSKDRDFPTVADVAKAALEKPYDGAPFHALADAMEESQHPLADRYNWAAIPEKLLHDAATLKVVKSLARRQQRRRVEDGYPRPRLLHAANGVLIGARDSLGFGHGPGEWTNATPHRDAIAAHLQQHFPHITDRQIRDSMARLHDRVNAAMSVDASSFPDLYHSFRQQNSIRPLAELQDEAAAAHDKYDPDGDAAQRDRRLRSKLELHTATRFSRLRVGGVKAALQLLRSRNQQQRRGVAADVLAKLGLRPSRIRDAVTASGAPVASVLAAIYHGGDEAKSEAAAAWFGHLLQLPSVTAFHADGDGPDAVYKLTLPLGPSEAADFLRSHGVGRVVLAPNGDATDAVVHDPGLKQQHRVAAAAAAANLGDVQVTRGRSVRLGGSDRSQTPTAAARRSYRDVISAFEAANARNPAD